MITSSNAPYPLQGCEYIITQPAENRHKELLDKINASRLDKAEEQE